MMTLILWILLFIFSWPLALMSLILYPFFLILSIPFRLLGITLDALFALLTAILFLPARILGQRV